MKLLLSLLLILLVSIAHAQKNIFVRVYNLEGKKIYKGDVYTTTDSSLLLAVNNQFITVPVSNIGQIKTKHSAGNNLLISSVIGVTTFAIIGATSAEPDAELGGYSAADGAGAGALVGAGVGAAIGGITLLFKNSKTFTVNGDMNKWKAFQSFIKPKSAGK